jgi:hypothetical protein
MSFNADFYNPDLNGLKFDSKIIEVKVRSFGADQKAVPQVNLDGTPMINPETQKQIHVRKWVGTYTVFVFANSSKSPLWAKNCFLIDYDPNKPAEQQFYEDAKKLTSQLPTGETISIFDNVLNVD